MQKANVRNSSVNEEFSERLKGLGREVARLEAEAAQDPGTRPHVEVICLHSKKLLEAAEHEQELTPKRRAAVAVERLLRFAREFRAQRHAENAMVLLVASGASRDCYQDAMGAARAVGAKLDAERWPEPAVLLEPMATPATFVRDQVTRPLGVKGSGDLPLPFPLVFLPWYPVSALGALCLVHHEVGHNVDQDLGLATGLKPELERRLTEAGVSPHDVDTWLRWRLEIVADAFGAMFAGIAFAVEMTNWSWALDDDDPPASASHPFPPLRVALARELLGLLGLSAPELSELLAVPDAREVTQRFVSHVPIVARAIHEAAIPGLKGRSMTALAPDVAREHHSMWDASSALVNGTEYPWKELRLRMIPPVARLAVSRGADAAQVAAMLTDPAVVSGRGAVSIPFDQARFVQATLRDSVPPILDEEREGLKLPPSGLFEAVRKVSFVGATNDGLPELFARWRGRPRKQRIEVFFLRRDALAGLERDGNDRDELLKLWKLGRDGLTPELLDDVAEEWALYEHSEPYVFAAYYDAEAPGGRIHVSAHGWGQDLKRAPSHDYTWPVTSEAAERTYEFYLSALSSLRQRATPMSVK